MKDLELYANWMQLKMGADVGAMRTIRAILKNSKHRATPSTTAVESYTNHIIGAQAELIVAEWLNLHWHGATEHGVIDVGGLVEVRASTRLTHDLCLHKWDRDEPPYVSVLVTGAKFVVHGWLFGHEGKKLGTWRDGREGEPAYWVERGLLRDLDDLKRWVEENRHLAPLKRNPKPEDDE